MAKSANHRTTTPRPPLRQPLHTPGMQAPPGGKSAIQRPAPVHRNSSSRADGLWLGCPSDGGLSAASRSGVQFPRSRLLAAKYP